MSFVGREESLEEDALDTQKIEKLLSLSNPLLEALMNFDFDEHGNNQLNFKELKKEAARIVQQDADGFLQISTTPPSAYILEK